MCSSDPVVFIIRSYIKSPRWLASIYFSQALHYHHKVNIFAVYEYFSKDTVIDIECLLFTGSGQDKFLKI